MTLRHKMVLVATLAAAVAQFSTGAQAAISWTFDGPNCVGASDNGCSNDEFDKWQRYESNQGGSNPTVKASGWANTLGTSNTNLELGRVARYGGGLGVRNSDHPGSGRSDTDGREGSNPEHAVDNDERYDFVLFEFDSDVALSEIQLGWFSSDSDISVLAFTDPVGPGDDPAADLPSFEYTATNEDLTDNGWKLIGNYDVDNIDPSGGSSQRAAINPDGESSSFWIVGAYNSVFENYGCAPEKSDPNKSYCQDDTYKDYFKINELVAHMTPPPPGVPEPASLALLTLGVAWIGATRRRRTAAKDAA